MTPKSIAEARETNGHSLMLQQWAGWIREKQKHPNEPSWWFDWADVDTEALIEAAAEIDRLTEENDRLTAVLQGEEP